MDPILQLLEDVVSNQSKQEEIRAFLSSKGVGRLMAFLIELDCERARKKLDLAGPRALYQAKLSAYIGTLSLVGAGETGG